MYAGWRKRSSPRLLQKGFGFCHSFSSLAKLLGARKAFGSPPPPPRATARHAGPRPPPRLRLVTLAHVTPCHTDAPTLTSCRDGVFASRDGRMAGAVRDEHPAPQWVEDARRRTTCRARGRRSGRSSLAARLPTPQAARKQEVSRGALGAMPTEQG